MKLLVILSTCLILNSVYVNAGLFDSFLGNLGNLGNLNLGNLGNLGNLANFDFNKILANHDQLLSALSKFGLNGQQCTLVSDLLEKHKLTEFTSFLSTLKLTEAKKAALLDFFSKALFNLNHQTINDNTNNNNNNNNNNNIVDPINDNSNNETPIDDSTVNRAARNIEKVTGFLNVLCERLSSAKSGADLSAIPIFSKNLDKVLELCKSLPNRNTEGADRQARAAADKKFVVLCEFLNTFMDRLDKLNIDRINVNDLANNIKQTRELKDVKDKKFVVFCQFLDTLLNNVDLKNLSNLNNLSDLSSNLNRSARNLDLINGFINKFFSNIQINDAEN